MTTEEKATAYDEIVEMLKDMDGFEDYPVLMRVQTAIARSNHLVRFGKRSRDAWAYTSEDMPKSILKLMRDLNNS